MSVLRRTRRPTAHLVTEASRPKSEDISHRERRYLIMMGIRVVCFVAAVVMVVQGAGWLAAIPAAGAIVIPYFAVVLANSGREPASRRGFRPYEPSLPARYEPPPQQPRESAGTAAGSQPGTRAPAGPGAARPDPAGRVPGNAGFDGGGYGGAKNDQPGR